MNTIITDGAGPKCPNHGCPLVDLGFPMPKSGIGTCPVSGAPFEFSVELDETKMVRDKNGNMSKAEKWNVEGND